MAATFVVSKSGTGFRFQLLAGNAEEILASEVYTTKASAMTGIAAVKSSSGHDLRFARLTSKAGQPYFVLKGANHEVIGTSEMYSSPAARDLGIEAVRVAAPAATIVERT